MDLAHLHLMLNHVPVMGVVFGFLVALIGAFARSKAAVHVGLITLVAAGLMTIPVYLTGDSAGEIVENVPGLSEGFVDQHESAATLSLVLAGLSGCLAFLTLLSTRLLTPKVAGILFGITLAATMGAGASMMRTANLGGQIRHTEIRSTAPAQQTERQTPAKRGDDDD